MRPITPVWTSWIVEGLIRIQQQACLTGVQSAFIIIIVPETRSSPSYSLSESQVKSTFPFKKKGEREKSWSWKDWREGVTRDDEDQLALSHHKAGLRTERRNNQQQREDNWEESYCIKTHPIRFQPLDSPFLYFIVSIHHHRESISSSTVINIHTSVSSITPKNHHHHQPWNRWCPFWPVWIASNWILWCIIYIKQNNS